MTHCPDVLKWLKRIQRKGPYILIKTTDRDWWKGGESAIVDQYTVVWRDDGKLKIGEFHDGMAARYGVQTRGVLKGPTASSLWQASSGVIDDYELGLLISYWPQDLNDLPNKFDPATQIMDLTW